MTSLNPRAIAVVTGRGIPLRGDDIDTDRIMPARFLRLVSFEGLERHLFEDDRAADPRHPFGDARYAERPCSWSTATSVAARRASTPRRGSSDAGIRALVGESFSEIFQGNAAMLGVPCFVADGEVARLQALVEQQPATEISVSVLSGGIAAGPLRVQGTVPPALRDAF